jgi:NADPH-dependent ferric siderophore reductase
MSPSECSPTTVRARREPPPFRRVTVRRVERLSPRMVRVTVGGRDLEGLVVAQPAASVRLLLPSPAGHDLERQ